MCHSLWNVFNVHSKCSNNWPVEHVVRLGDRSGGHETPPGLKVDVP